MLIKWQLVKERKVKHKYMISFNATLWKFLKCVECYLKAEVINLEIKMEQEVSLRMMIQMTSEFPGTGSVLHCR